MRFLQEPAMAHTNDQDLLTDLYKNVIYFLYSSSISVVLGSSKLQSIQVGSFNG